MTKIQRAITDIAIGRAMQALGKIKETTGIKVLSRHKVGATLDSGRYICAIETEVIPLDVQTIRNLFITKYGREEWGKLIKLDHRPTTRRYTITQKNCSHRKQTSKFINCGSDDKSRSL